MSSRFTTALAGVAGGAVALGVAELVHGLYPLMPSLPVAVSQRIIGITPGGVATSMIGTLGKAAVPILVVSVVVATLAIAGLLAVLALRSALLAAGGVGLLGAIALLSAFAEPSISVPVTVVAVIGSLAIGSAVAGALLDRAPRQARDSEEEPAQAPAPETAESQMAGVRRRDAGASSLTLGRRNFLLLSGGATAGGLAVLGAGRLLSGRGEAITPVSSGGSPSGGAAPELSVDRLPPPPESASIEVPGMPKLITPAEDFYLIDTAISSPRIDRDRWTLSVGGDDVSNPIELSYDDLISSFRSFEADITMSCVSNEVGGGLVSHGRWSGVLLSDVLEEAGLRREEISRASEQLVGRAVDGWEAGFKTDIAFDGREAMVVFGLNGEELPAKHGYPVRLVVPGLYGYISATKWLSEIELKSWDYDVYWVKRGWSKTGPVKTQSRIDTISGGEELQAGTIPVGGVAWAPTRGIQRVEVSTDGGETWNDARLATQLDVDAWRQYVYEWDARPGEYTVQVRATDGEGETQTEERAEPIPSGATGYHTIDVTVV